MPLNQEVSDYINNAAPEQVELLETLRQLIHQSVPGTTEAIKWRMPVFSNGNNFAYLQTAKKHVTLGFYNPEKIEDPDQLLEGAGKTMKHIKLKTMEEVNAPLLTSWLKAITEA